MISGPIRDWRMRSVKAGASYFILVLAVGWILGPIRTVWAAPRFGGHMATNDLIRAMILAAALAATTFAANAQTGAGDPQAGGALAHRVCSPCHAVEPDPHAPRMFQIGPDFQTVANTPGMTATALNAFLLTSHPKMPNFILSREQSADVIAYILSLQHHP